MTNTASLTPNTKTSLTDALQKALADSFVLYFKTHSFHWNVEGPHFHALHIMFEGQYNEIWTALDELAERMRALDEYAPISYTEMIQNAHIDEGSQMPSAMDMSKILAEDNLAVADTLQSALEIAQEAGDEASADLMIVRIAAHEKAAWMLRSTAK
jgi:starvation-inducible DNA-binding protein